jgi:hypothetical protein
LQGSKQREFLRDVLAAAAIGSMPRCAGRWRGENLNHRTSACGSLDTVAMAPKIRSPSATFVRLAQ